MGKTTDIEKYALQNLDCADCALKLEKRLTQLDSVREVSSVHTALLHRKDLIRIGAALVVFIFGLIFKEKMRNTPFSYGEYAVFLAAYLISGWEVLYTAGKNILRGKIFDEHFLMSIATIGAILINALPEAVGVMLFFKIGQYFEQLALTRSRKSIQSLLALKPEYANLEHNGNFKRVEPEAVKVDDTILVKPGGEPQGSELRGPMAREVTLKWPRVAAIASKIV